MGANSSAWLMMTEGAPSRRGVFVGFLLGRGRAVNPVVRQLTTIAPSRTERNSMHGAWKHSRVALHLHPAALDRWVLTADSSDLCPPTVIGGACITSATLAEHVNELAGGPSEETSLPTAGAGADVD